MKIYCIDKQRNIIIDATLDEEIKINAVRGGIQIRVGKSDIWNLKDVKYNVHVESGKRACIELIDLPPDVYNNLRIWNEQFQSRSPKDNRIFEWYME